jgi:hypothetical protein
VQQAQEDAYNNKTEDLKRKSEEGGLVQRNKAKNELAQHLAEDPLPLRKAKITQEAAVKKTERAAVAAEAAAQEAARAKEAAEAAFAEASKRVEEAEAYLEKAKNSLPHGGVWWMVRSAVPLLFLFRISDPVFVVFRRAGEGAARGQGLPAQEQGRLQPQGEISFSAPTAVIMSIISSHHHQPVLRTAPFVSLLLELVDTGGLNVDARSRP